MSSGKQFANENMSKRNIKKTWKRNTKRKGKRKREKFNSMGEMTNLT